MKKSCNKYILPFLLGCVAVYVFFMFNRDDWQHHHDHAVSALQESRYQDVIKSCDEAIKLNPKHPKIYAIYTKKARALVKIHEYNAALDSTNQAIAKNPNYEDAYLVKVDALFMQNKDSELAAVLEEILKLNPHTPLKGLLNTLRLEQGKWCY